MKRFRLSFILITTAVLTIFIVQSCNEDGGIVQPSQPTHNSSIIENQFSNSNITVTNVTPLEADTKTLEKVISTYSGGKIVHYKGLRIPLPPKVADHAKRTPFNKHMLGKLEYSKGKVYTYNDGSKIVSIPAAKIEKKGIFRSSRLIIKKNKNGDIKNAYLSEFTTSKEFINKLKRVEKESEQSGKRQKILFTGTVKLYTLNGKEIKNVRGVKYKNGHLKETLNFNNNNISSSKIAGGAMAPNSCCEEIFHSITESWNHAVHSIVLAAHQVGDFFTNPNCV